MAERFGVLDGLGALMEIGQGSGDLGLGPGLVLGVGAELEPGVEGGGVRLAGVAGFPAVGDVRVVAHPELQAEDGRAVFLRIDDAMAFGREPAVERFELLAQLRHAGRRVSNGRLRDLSVICAFGHAVRVARGLGARRAARGSAGLGLWKMDAGERSLR